MQRSGKEAELRAELAFHLEEDAEQRQADGLGGKEAQWAARRELGNLSLVAENTRAVWGWTVLEQLGQDLHYAFRTMAGNRLFTLLAVSSLGLGIAANTAIYSFMESLLLRALPVPHPESLVVVLVLAVVGMTIGMGAALAFSRLVALFLWGVRPNDPLVLTLALTVLLSATLLAGYVPARKASRIDPMAAVRHD